MVSPTAFQIPNSDVVPQMSQSEVDAQFEQITSHYEQPVNEGQMREFPVSAADWARRGVEQAYGNKEVSNAYQPSQERIDLYHAEDAGNGMIDAALQDQRQQFANEARDIARATVEEQAVEVQAAAEMYTFIRDVGPKLESMRDYEVALQSPDFVDGLRSKAVNRI